MKNYRSEGKTMNLVAPGGGVTSGGVYIVGGILCVAMSDADATYPFPGLVEGVCGLTKASGTTAAAGAAAYYNSSTGLIETADSSSNRRIGVFAEAATDGNTNARVRLDGVSFGDGNTDLESKVDKIASPVAGDIVIQTAGGGIAVGGIAPSEIVAVADLASVANGKGASGVGLEDADGNTDETDVEGAIAEIYGGLNQLGERIQAVEVVVSLGSPSGASAADDDMIGATVIGCAPVSGNDQVIVSAVVGVDGAITVTLAGNSTAEATFSVGVILAD